MRTSLIGGVKINNVVGASVAFFGDNWVISCKAKVWALRRDIPTFGGKEGSIAAYPFYRRIAPHLAEGGEPVMEKWDECPIRVGGVKLLSVSTSSVFQAGSTRTVESAVWIKHFRQLVDQGVPTWGKGTEGGVVDMRPPEDVEEAEGMVGEDHVETSK